MKRMTIGLAMLVMALNGSADVPQFINFQGRLLEGTNLVNGAVGLSLRLFNMPTSGPMLYEDSNTVVVTDGLYATTMGDGTVSGSLAAALTNAEVWLEMAVNGTALTPRERVSAVAYALRAESAHGVVPGGIAAGMIAEGAVGNAELATNAVTGSRIADGSVSNDDIAAGTIAADRIVPGTFTLLAGDTMTGALTNRQSVSAQRFFCSQNTVLGTNAVALGGSNNTIAAKSSYSVIGGGLDNDIGNDAWYAAVAGGYNNNLASNTDYGVIGGGYFNDIHTNAQYATVAGGNDNNIGADADNATIGGGQGNDIGNLAWYTAIAGGYDNNVGLGSDSVAIGGGYNNNVGAVADFSAIGGGQNNDIGGNSSHGVVAGGYENNIGTNSSYSAIGGGTLNAIGNNAPYAYAAGRRAKANHPGSFVWGDSTDADIASTASNQFLIRASGGVGIGTVAPTRRLQVTETSSGSLTYPLKVSNEADTTNTSVGVLFQVDSGGNRGKGAIVYERTATWNRGKFHFLQGTGANTDIPDIGDAVMTIANDGNIGIGTTGPDKKLHVEGAAQAQRFFNSLNHDLGTNSVAIGGTANAIAPSAGYSVIAGGRNNDIGTNSPYSAVGGGHLNSIGNTSTNGTIAGGFDNNIAEGNGNSAIGGGNLNDIGAQSHYSAIAGGSGNEIAMGSSFSTIAGGDLNLIYNVAPHATIAGGSENKIDAYGEYGAIGGGRFNYIGFDSPNVTIAGGRENQVDIDSASCAIGGGYFNYIGSNSSYSTIGGGSNNYIGARARCGTIAGGHFNTIGNNADFSFIAGGLNNEIGADAAGSFAGGHDAKAHHYSSFVWGGRDVWGTSTESTNGYSVTMSASGGYRLFSGNEIGAALAPNATAWSAISDRNAKENFAPIDTAGILDKVAALPLTAWSYKADPDHRRYIGPVAQDFHAAFGLGDDKTINTLDTDGVALAAIQALARENEELKARLERLEAMVKAR